MRRNKKHHLKLICDIVRFGNDIANMVWKMLVGKEKHTSIFLLVIQLHCEVTLECFAVEPDALAGMF